MTGLETKNIYVKQCVEFVSGDDAPILGPHCYKEHNVQYHIEVSVTYRSLASVFEL